jgi:hypothetical protein
MDVDGFDKNKKESQSDKPDWLYWLLMYLELK